MCYKWGTWYCVSCNHPNRILIKTISVKNKTSPYSGWDSASLLSFCFTMMQTSVCVFCLYPVTQDRSNRPPRSPSIAPGDYIHMLKGVDKSCAVFWVIRSKERVCSETKMMTVKTVKWTVITLPYKAWCFINLDVGVFSITFVMWKLI